jgi:hypothetical protein
LRLIYRIKKRKWLIISWLALFGTFALLSLTIGNTVKPYPPNMIFENPDFLRYFNQPLWSPLYKTGFLPWDSPGFTTVWWRWRAFIGGMIWWALLSSAIVYASNYLLKTPNRNTR